MVLADSRICTYSTAKHMATMHSKHALCIIIGNYRPPMQVTEGSHHKCLRYIAACWKDETPPWPVQGHDQWGPDGSIDWCRLECMECGICHTIQSLGECRELWATE